MNNYKHGNWYCKPANEAEAKEIVARALVSGAMLHQSVGDGIDKNRWDLREFWGVVSGYTINLHNVQCTDHTMYTIQQVREKFPLPSELQIKVGPHFEHEQKEVVRSDVKVSIYGKPSEWDGTGWPPVGTVCNVLHRELSENKPSLKECRIIELLPQRKIGNQTNCLESAIYLIDTDLCRDVGMAGAGNFYPIKTERERWVSEAQKHCTEFGSNQLGKLYDALKSGDLKAPE